MACKGADVLVVSAMSDPHAQEVMSGIEASGFGVELLDLSQFPTQLSLSLGYEDAQNSFCIERNNGSCLDLRRVGSIWWRRPQDFVLDDRMTDATVREFAERESAMAFHGLFQSLQTEWINHPVRNCTAAHKPWQLKVAQEVGLLIPPTLITNNPQRAREFWKAHGNDVIYKQFVAVREAWRETRRLKADEKQLAHSISLAPVIFQGFVRGVADLRVIAIGSQLFAAAARIADAEYVADVRMNPGITYEPHQLPAAVQTKILEFMERMGLTYGALDFRLTPAGEYVFFEVNPGGQFLYIEQHTELKIKAALVDALVAPCRKQ